MHFDEFDAFTWKLCQETQKTILSLYENPDLEIELKGDMTPVTFADKEAEREIRKAIQALYPDHGIKGEEFDDHNPDAPFTWVLDPIDGTKSFTASCPLFGTMIALLHEGEPIFGCINFPALGKRISGDGQTASVNGSPVKASTTRSLNEAILLTTDQRDVARFQDRDAFDRLVDATRFTRTWGDCYGYYLLATGNADIMLDPEMSPWDIMALVPIIRGAGATITDWNGGDPAKGDSIVAAASHLHEETLAILNGKT